ncbi:fumarylacetoacetate hydrolase family protein [Thalassococcus sp. CAU 1522]|uniref:Fumarylacetoacetate hydrolase family protein n=1 Tax=Thalassococcus arenae TaxID=2851652 RepID=A0ABS6NAG6_9RHOB|nr:fumarylacetoacetate hydrolase family protein [Thalassococcus arenae]MBV2361002.1 fumarylacetoacetate hydrolase family protein [Thalassococcus arenae]
MAYLFPPRPQPALSVQGTDALYPVARIFCVGRNYVEHAREMGGEVDREAPFYFTKSPHHIALTGTTLPYPPGTSDYHHEVELVVALGAPLVAATEAEAMDAVYGYGVGLDMTRRDLQAQAKDKRRPWDIGKDVEGSAVLGPLTPAADFGTPGPQRIALTVNGETRQQAHLSDMVWPVGPLLAHLSGLYTLGAGDLVMMGTPAGVGPVRPGDALEATLDGCAPLHVAFKA